MGMFDMFKSKGTQSNFAVDMVLNMFGGLDGLKAKIMESIYPSLEKWLIGRLDQVQLKSYEDKAVVVIYKNKKTDGLNYAVCTITKDDEIERVLDNADLKETLSSFLDKVDLKK